MISRLDLVPGTSSRHGLHYWEPVVDGRPLRDLLAEADGVDDIVGDHVPVLVHNWPVPLLDDVLVLLGERESELTSGRAPLFVCSACADLGCGAITATVERTPETVVWRDFGWEVNYVLDDEDDDDRLSAGPVVFDRAQYESELRRFVDTFGEVRASLPPRAGLVAAEPARRRRWWPFG